MVFDWYIVAALGLCGFMAGVEVGAYNERRFQRWRQRMAAELRDTEREADSLIAEMNAPVVDELERPHVN